MFRIGQKVVRIGSSPGRGGQVPAGVSFSKPDIGDVVTIATINEWSFGTLLTFREHDNRHLIGGFNSSRHEPGFNAECFRPVVARKTDISIFKKMLTPTKRHADA